MAMFCECAPSFYFFSRGGTQFLGGCRQNVSRRYSFPLRSGHRTAYLCTETTMYRYTESLDTPKKWFKANIDEIMHIYGPHHPIQKEDIFLGAWFCLLG